MTSRRTVVAALHLLALLAVVVATVTQLDRPLAPVLPQASGGEPLISVDYLERMRDYRTPRYLVAALALALSVAVPAWWALSRRGRRVVERVIQRVGAHRPGRAAALVAALILVSLDLVLLPAAFWTGFVQEGQFGFRTQGAAGWTRDWLVARAPLWLGALVVTPLALLLVRRLPRAWPPVAGLGAGLVVAVLTLLAPLLLEPLWLRTTPLEPGPVRSAVEEVLDRADTRVDDIVVGDASRRTTKANAYVSGLGSTRRVVLFDTMLRDFSPEEIGVVLAHELAHDRHGDIPRGVWSGVAGGVVTAYVLAFALRRSVRAGTLPDVAHPRAVPLALLLVAVLTAASLPVQNLLSRRAEAAADWAALELTRDPGTFASMQWELARSHLADPDPPTWVRVLWGSHPTVRERIGMAHAWAQRETRGGPRLDSAP